VAVGVAHARGCHKVRSHMDRRPSINKQQAHASKMRLVLMRACGSSSSPAIAILLGRQHPLSYSTTFPLVSPPITTDGPTLNHQQNLATQQQHGRSLAATLRGPRDAATILQRPVVQLRAKARQLGVEPLTLTTPSVSATSDTGGYPNPTQGYPAHPAVSLDPIQVHSGSIDKPKGHHAGFVNSISRKSRGGWRSKSDNERYF
jgi:hypothetical protein